MIYKPPDIDRPVFVFQFFFFSITAAPNTPQILPDFPEYPQPSPEKGKNLTRYGTMQKKTTQCKEKENQTPYTQRSFPPILPSTRTPFDEKKQCREEEKHALTKVMQEMMGTNDNRRGDERQRKEMYP